MRKFNHYVIVTFNEITIKTAVAVGFCTAITGFALIIVNTVNAFTS
jgi:hypothetical protein